MQKHLSDLTLKSLAEGEYWDAKLPSFGVRIGKRSTTFLLKKGNRRLKLGNYPFVTLQDARKRAFALKADPETASVTISLKEALALFYDTHCKDYRPKVIYETKRYLAKYDLYESHKLSKITTHHLNDIIDKQTRAEANKLFAVSRTFFRFCVKRRFITRSPLEGLALPNKEQSRARVLTDDELKAVWKAAEQTEGHFGTIVRLLILTGQRRGEIAALRPEYCDLARVLASEETSNEYRCQCTITLPKELTKNGREHQFPIGTLALSCLGSSLSDLSSQLLFPARGSSVKSFNGWSKSKVAFDKLSSVKDWTLHDLRRTFATRLAEMGVAPHVIERLLNHVTGSLSPIALVYNRATFMNEMRQAIDLWESRLRSLVGS